MVETFRRSEKKYLLTSEQYEKLMELLKDHVVQDKFFESDIRSIYYDTDKFQMIRRSIEKPEYKEKLRIRAYSEIDEDQPVFVEFKKKLDGVVYKRRTRAILKDVLDDINSARFEDEQIGNEIRYALSYYQNVRPAIYIGCKRTSYVGKQDKSLRITFDKDVSYRMKHLSLKAADEDRKVTDKIIMELKVKGAMPLWLSEILDEVKAYPRGFSKVGTAFENEIRRRNNHD